MGSLMKTYADSSLYFVKSNWSRLIVCMKSKFTRDMENCFGTLDDCIEKGEYLKQGKSSTVSVVTLDNKRMVIKRYNIKDKFHGLRRAFRPSRASVSWENAHMLESYGIKTAQPVAFIENRKGFLRSKSYLITEFEEGESCSNFFSSNKHSSKDKKIVAESIINVFIQLWAVKITHGDLKTSNILIVDKKAILIDLDSMVQHSREAALIKAYDKDINRFFKNWRNDNVNNALFKSIYNEKLKNL